MGQTSAKSRTYRADDKCACGLPLISPDRPWWLPTADSEPGYVVTEVVRHGEDPAGRAGALRVGARGASCASTHRQLCSDSVGARRDPERRDSLGRQCRERAHRRSLYPRHAISRAL